MICSKESSNLLCFNDATQSYEPFVGTEPLPEEVIKVNDFFYATSKAIFVWNENGLELIKFVED